MSRVHWVRNAPSAGSILSSFCRCLTNVFESSLYWGNDELELTEKHLGKNVIGDTSIISVS